MISDINFMFFHTLRILINILKYHEFFLLAEVKVKLKYKNLRIVGQII